MVVRFQHAFGMVECPASPLSFVPPRRVAPGPASIASITAALPKPRLLAALTERLRKRRSGSTGPNKPPEEPASDDIWSDPAFYMLMIH